MSTRKRGVLVGIVHSDKMHKSITVDVETRRMERTYGKYVRSTRRIMVHDEREEAGPGDRVEIEETRPLSKRKSWRLLRILDTGHGPQEVPTLPEEASAS
ncbi:MAG: 30S ribosomal protein S17 [Planctomycetaceae bacterium]